MLNLESGGGDPVVHDHDNIADNVTTEHDHDNIGDNVTTDDIVYDHSE